MEETIVIPVSEKLPLANHRVLVVTKEFRCLAYIDKEGHWKDAAKNEEVPEVIGWFEF